MQLFAQHWPDCFDAVGQHPLTIDWFSQFKQQFVALKQQQNYDVRKLAEVERLDIERTSLGDTQTIRQSSLGILVPEDPCLLCRRGFGSTRKLGCAMTWHPRYIRPSMADLMKVM